jgi:FMN-dependent NADH-azoreductase
MSTLLRIESSPRGEYSVSRKLTSLFVEQWQKNHPDGHVVARDLMKTDLPWVDLPWIAGAYTPTEQHTPEMIKALEISNTLIAELQAADHIVFGISMYNFSTPAILKAYIDHIVRVNVTFTPSYEGLLKGKKVTVLLASAGIYTPGAHSESYNFETGYLKHILGFIGLTDVNFVLAGGTVEIDHGKISAPDFVAKFASQVADAAK